MCCCITCFGICAASAWLQATGAGDVHLEDEEQEEGEIYSMYRWEASFLIPVLAQHLEAVRCHAALVRSTFATKLSK